MNAVRRSLMNAKGSKELPNYVHFTALEDNSTLAKGGSYGSTLEYSADGRTWANFTSTAITLDKDDVVYIRGNNNQLSSSGNTFTHFDMTGSFKVGGNMMSLLHKENFNSEFSLPNKTYTFCKLFQSTSCLKDASELLFPATTLRGQCYQQTFYNCTGLEKAPIELPATTLTSGCYQQMFYGTKIQTAPILPAATVASNAYLHLFRECMQLNYIKMLATNVSNLSSSSWVEHVPSGGIFVKHIDATWTTTGKNGVPTGWTIIYYDPTDDKYYTDQTKATECDDHGNPI